MTKQNEQEALGTAMNKTEMFFEKNSKSMIIALLALFVLAAAIFGYRQLISQPRERKAAEMIAQAQYRFESTTPEYQLALEGEIEERLLFRCKVWDFAHRGTSGRQNDPGLRHSTLDHIEALD